MKIAALAHRSRSARASQSQFEIKLKGVSFMGGENKKKNFRCQISSKKLKKFLIIEQA
jgi:hypothetical protein